MFVVEKGVEIWLNSGVVGCIHVLLVMSLEETYWNLEQTTQILGKSWEVGHGLGLDEVKLQLG